MLCYFQDALERQKSCADKRANSKDVGSLQIRVKGWLEGEIDVVSVKIQAKSSLETLREDRKTLAGQLLAALSYYMYLSGFEYIKINQNFAAQCYEKF